MLEDENRKQKASSNQEHRLDRLRFMKIWIEDRRESEKPSLLTAPGDRAARECAQAQPRGRKRTKQVQEDRSRWLALRFKLRGKGNRNGTIGERGPFRRRGPGVYFV